MNQYFNYFRAWAKKITLNFTSTTVKSKDRSKHFIKPDVMRSVCCNSTLVNFNKEYDQCFVCEKIQRKQTDAHTNEVTSSAKP